MTSNQATSLESLEFPSSRLLLTLDLNALTYTIASDFPENLQRECSDCRDKETVGVTFLTSLKTLHEVAFFRYAVSGLYIVDFYIFIL
ncbi:unnamed protein product [Peronospora belbahrii]|uniref:Uncharacterized protein n=1 Tax=Peronospora belbahrii TaxID=622444 RepID=A0ABN8CM97_9STRA|nr:unnamed protein product [Peronospora belbahrii]